MRFIGFLVVLIVILVTIVKCVEAGETADDIAYLLTANDRDLSLRPWPNRVLAKNKAKRDKLADIIDAAVADYPAISAEMLVATAYRESSFRPTAVGPVGERSLFQFQPATAHHVRLKLDPRCNLRTVAGSAYCAAAWLANGVEYCGSLKGAIVRYITTRGRCVASSSKVDKKADLRIALIKYLENRRFRSFMADGRNNAAAATLTTKDQAITANKDDPKK